MVQSLFTILEGKDCALVTGLPVNFIHFVSSRLWGDFASGISYLRYRSRWVGPFQRAFRPFASQYGLSIFECTSKQGLQAVILRRYSFLLLITHHLEGRLELRGGLIRDADLLGMVPKDYCGIIELAGCDTDGLANDLKGHAPNCSLLGSTIETPTDVCIVYYRTLLSSLLKFKLPYYDAVVAANASLLRLTSRLGDGRNLEATRD